MIKPEELMIGNYVNDENGFQMEVCSIADDGTVYCDFDGNEGDVWEFDKKNPPVGIEITHEEMLRFGFNFHKEPIKIYTVEGVKGYFDLDENGVLSWYVMHIIISPFQHVHQLQNLFYILTGKQLRYS